MRTDQMLTALEELNVLEVEQVPASWLWQLGDLAADLPRVVGDRTRCNKCC